jgi:GPH family glycoside/pentoside/hexuronide:cation symporter
MALTLGALMCAAGLVATVGTWAFRRPAPLMQTTRRAAWSQVVGNRSFARLAAASSAYYVAVVFSAVLSLYFLSYYAALDSGRAIAICQAAIYGGAIAGVWLWTRAATLRDKHQLYLASCVLLAGALAAAYWIAAPGHVPDEVRLAAIAAAHAAIGATASGPAVFAPSMLADVAAEDEMRSGERRDGVFFGMFSAVQQIATGIAAAAAGPLVDRYAGLIPGAAEQGATTVARLGVLACFLPAALLLVSAALIATYTLSRQQVSLLQRQLLERTCAHS